MPFFVELKHHGLVAGEENCCRGRRECVQVLVMRKKWPLKLADNISLNIQLSFSWPQYKGWNSQVVLLMQQSRPLKPDYQHQTSSQLAAAGESLQSWAAGAPRRGLLPCCIHELIVTHSHS